MKKLLLITTWIIEFLILIALIYKHYIGSVFGITELWTSFFVLLFFLLILNPVFWYHKKNLLDRSCFLKLTFLTLPSIVFCFSLILGLSIQLFRNSDLEKKETQYIENIAQQNNIADKFFKQWYEVKVENVKSDIFAYTLLLACLCLLYKARYSSTKIIDNSKIK